VAGAACDEPLGLEPFDELRVSSKVEKLGAERLSRVVTDPTNVYKGWEFYPLPGIKSKPISLGSDFCFMRTLENAGFVSYDITFLASF
jgi:hypothetical protein